MRNVFKMGPLLVAAASLFSHSALAGERLARCTLKVDDEAYYEDKACVFRVIDSAGSFTIGVSENPERAANYFAYVFVTNGIGTGSWNGTDGASHAHDSLGELINQHNGCWINERATVCAK